MPRLIFSINLAQVSSSSMTSSVRIHDVTGMILRSRITTSGISFLYFYCQNQSLF